MTKKVIPSSGNVFEELGFPPEEAEHLRIRSALMATTRKVTEERGLTQARAAALFRVSQPRVTDLVRGRIDLFSIETLVEMLARAGVRMELVVQTAGVRWRVLRRALAPLRVPGQQNPKRPG